MQSMEFTLNIFTLNCWGIPVVAKNRMERFQAIAKYLVNSQHNIVCLQEVWSENDFLFLKESLKVNLPYSHYFYSGVIGSGLCVFSKWLIQDVFFHQWPLNGYIHKIHHGDWFGGKGVGLCRIRVRDRLVNVYCTHLHAEYHTDDIYLAHRVLQAYSTAELFNLTSSPADISILAGDLNTAPGDLAFKLITQLASLTDPYDLRCLPTNSWRPSGTSHNCNNSYSDPTQSKMAPEGKRIDHILFQVNSAWQADVINFGNPLEDRVPNQDFSYSDHNAVALELTVKPLEKSTHLRHDSKELSLDQTVFHAIKVCEEAMVTVKKSSNLFIYTGAILFMFLIGTVGFWPSNVLYDVLKIALTVFSIYYLWMGTLWNKIEMNSLKAGHNGLLNFSRTRSGFKNGRL